MKTLTMINISINFYFVHTIQLLIFYPVQGITTKVIESISNKEIWTLNLYKSEEVGKPS